MRPNHTTLRTLAFLTLVAALLPTAGPAQAHDGLHACDYQPNYRDVPCAEVDRAISESAAEFQVDDLKLRKIVRCESRFNPYADSGHYRGLFQQAPEYWQNRVAQFNAHHDPDAGNNIYSPFDNARISARMLAAGLDGHWPNCA
jgi:hypothetical protein